VWAAAAAAPHHGHGSQQKLLVVDEPVLVPVECLEVLSAVLALGADAGQQLGELGHGQRL
jgi:hypothetical protein